MSICKLKINDKCQYKSTGGKEIGSGAYGSVTIVKKNDKNFAFKRLRDEDDETGDFEERDIRNPIELDILFRIRSPYLNKGEAISEIGECDPNFIGLVVEIIKGNLYDSLKKKELNYTQKKKIMRDVTMGLKCLHDNDFVHLDIKPDNMMYNIDKDKNVTGILIDYGLCTYNPKNKPFVSQHPRITPSFEAPENLLEFRKDGSKYYGEFDKSSDIWSLGISFCEIVNDNHHIVKTPSNNSKKKKKYLIENFNENKIEATLEETVFKYNLFPNEEEMKLFKDLVINMLMINPKERYTVENVLQHKYWFSKDYNTFSLVNICTEAKIDDYSLGYLNQLHLYGVFDVIDFCKKELKHLPLETFFMAIDIYLRVCSKCEFSEIMTKKKVKNLANYCCLVAYKFFNWSELDEEIHYDILEINTSEEIEIYKALEGKIHTERYFKAAETYQDLVNVFYGLIYPSEGNEAYFEIGKEQFVINKNIINYLNQDAKTYILSQRQNESLENSKAFNKHELKISDFFKY